ncbi:MAG: bifunctional oligoribonuclease/PAP phosphatase NrnA [bacterium]
MDYKLLTQKINEYNTIILHGHIRPDGDCYGSQFGLKELILNNFKNKNVYVVGEVSDYVKFLGDLDVIEDSLYKDALCISLDTGSGDRVSDQRYFSGKEKIKLDHHIPLDQYGDINIVDEHAPACAYLVAKYAIEENLEINEKCATILYTGIVTDTGRFRHGITDDLFKIAGILLNKGADTKYIDTRLSIESLNSLKLKGYVLSNFVTTEEGLAYVKLPLDVINEFNVSQEEAANQVGTISSIETCPVWTIFVESEKGVRCRIRSRGPHVDKIANKYNGGGHQMSCGANFNSMDEISDIIKDLNKLVEEYKASL